MYATLGKFIVSLSPASPYHEETKNMKRHEAILYEVLYEMLVVCFVCFVTS